MSDHLLHDIYNSWITYKLFQVRNKETKIEGNHSFHILNKLLIQSLPVSTSLFIQAPHYKKLLTPRVLSPLLVLVKWQFIWLLRVGEVLESCNEDKEFCLFFWKLGFFGKNVYVKMNVAWDGTKRAVLRWLRDTVPALTSYMMLCKSLVFLCPNVSPCLWNESWTISFLKCFPVPTFYILNIYEILPLRFSSRYLRTFILSITLRIITLLRG